MRFSERIILRALPPERGGHTMLIVRYARITGIRIINPTLRLNALRHGAPARVARPRDARVRPPAPPRRRRRVAMPSGDGIVRPCTLRLDSVDTSVIPGAFFLTHTIDETSPLYDSSRSRSK